MEKHYVCDECGAVSKNFGTCQNDLCIKQGVPLKVCYCEDGKHASILKMSLENADEAVDTGTGEVSTRHSDTILDLDATDSE